jgi:hypothetical protein
MFVMKIKIHSKSWKCSSDLLERGKTNFELLRSHHWRTGNYSRSVRTPANSEAKRLTRAGLPCGSPSSARVISFGCEFAGGV